MERWSHLGGMQNAMSFNHVFVLGGTTEGRYIVEYLQSLNISVTISVATCYGEEVLATYKGEHTQILQERLNQKGFESLLKEEKYDLVIDASHPYAKEATLNCKGACNEVGVLYKRIIREDIMEGWARDSTIHTLSILYFDTIEEIVHYLETTTGNVLLTTGSKDLEAYAQLAHFQERLYVRMLPLPQVLAAQLQKGYLMSHFICMQGPFSRALNGTMLEHVKARYMVTKASGDMGGVKEKLEAAQDVGVVVLCLRRPVQEEGMTLETFYKWIKEVTDGN